MPKPRFKHLWQTSQTKLWAYIQAAAAIATGALTYFNNVFQSQQFQDLEAKLNMPHWVPIALAVLAVITYAAHGHCEDA